jgi:hypothetical protein
MRPTTSKYRASVLLSCILLAQFSWNTCVAEPRDQAELKATIVARETAALESFRNHNKTLYKQLCLAEFYEVTSDGSINTLEDELQELDDYVLGPYKMEDVVVTLLSGDAALIRYNITAEYTYKGKVLPAYPMLATAVWVKVDNEWRAATYQEVQRTGKP